MKNIVCIIIEIYWVKTRKTFNPGNFQKERRSKKTIS